MEATSMSVIARWTQGVLRCGSGDFEVRRVCTDSRHAISKNMMFVALKGAHFDGHTFLQSVHELGVCAVMVERGSNAHMYGFDHVLEVEDTLCALQDLAMHTRQEFSHIPVVGITGSNGKTIVKDMLSSILARAYTVHRSPGSYNSQVGVALSLLELRCAHEVAVIEAGISRPGEMRRLARMIEPTGGVLTNVGLAHAAGLKSLEVTAREKLELFAHLGHGSWLVHPGDDPWMEQLQECGEEAERIPFYVREDDANLPKSGVVAFDVRKDHEQNGWSFRLRLEHGACTDVMRVHAPGRHNVANAAAAAAAALRLGCTREHIADGLAAFDLKPMRLEVHTTMHNVTFINDTYSSDPVSAQGALDMLRVHASGQRKIAILGAMLDLGARAKIEHEKLGEVAANAGVDLLVCLGEHSESTRLGALGAGMVDAQVVVCHGLMEVEAWIRSVWTAGDVVLFKASGALGLDDVVTRLFESVGPTRLLVDLDAIRSNYHAIRRRLGGDVMIMPVVKSGGYGNDATRISLTLVREGAPSLVVAYADEGVELRRVGLRLPVLVTNTLLHETDKFVRHDLTALVYTREVVESLSAHAQHLGVVVDVHVEVETGMNRTGISPEHAAKFCAFVVHTKGVRLAGMMTHFAAADDPKEDEFTRQQIALFEEALWAVRGAGMDPGLVHAANTAAAWRFPNASFEMVRVGIGLYGLAPSVEVEGAFQGVCPALKFLTRVEYLKTVRAGESVGYGRKWKAPSDAKIATIAAGYNDGLPRFLSNQGEVLIRGVRCPIVGHVCMDATMVDVTALGDEVCVGDEVVLFGAQGSAYLSIDEIAKKGGTISHEILCNISERVHRVFVRESR